MARHGRAYGPVGTPTLSSRDGSANALSIFLEMGTVLSSLLLLSARPRMPGFALINRRF